MNGKKTIWITSAGAGNAFATAETIHRYFKNKVHLLIGDCNPKYLVSASVFADEYIEMPLLKDPSYSSFVRTIIHEKKVDIVIPFMDVDVLNFARLFESGEKVDMQVRSSEYADICLDKYKTFLFCKQHDIPTPNTFLLDDKYDMKEGILKPRSGHGSVVQDITDDQVLKNLDQKAQWIFQEKCLGPEITVDVFKPTEIQIVFSICRERIETKSGVCTKAKIFFDTGLHQLAVKISELLQLKSFCFQVMQQNNQWVVTDINPRLGAGTAMSKEVGMDFFAATIADYMGEDFRTYLKQYNGVAYVTRQYKNILTTV